MLKQMNETNNKINAKNTLKEHSNLTSKKGITLIALVITIIVMLILVAVTVTIALNGGLFSTAKQAKVETENKINEEQNLASGKVEIDGEWYNSIEEYTDGGKGTTPTENDYGKYVKYGIDLNGDKNYENDWKVFYVDNDGNTFIIAADYVTGDKCDALKTAIGEDKAHMTQNTSSGREYCYYWKSSSDGVYHCYDGHNDSINNEHTTSEPKEQCSHPDLFMATGYYCSDHVGSDGKGGNPNSRCASALLCSGNWSSFVKTEEGASYAIGGPTLEMWIASWNQKHGNNESDTTKPLYCTGTSTNNYGYCVGTSPSPTTTSVSGSSYYGDSQEGYDDTLYFPHQSDTNDLDDDGTDETCFGYWLASPSAYYDGSLMYVGYGGYVGNSRYYGSGLRRSPRSLSNIWSQIGKFYRALELSRFWNTE